MIFDTHAHYTDAAFDEDRNELIERLSKEGVGLVMNNSCDRQSSKETIELVEKYPFMYAALGWHPENAEEFNDGCISELREWLKHPKVKAIGEIGLDYHYDEPSRQIQKQTFLRQLELAQELDVPVVIHDREAHGDCLDALDHVPKVRGEFHCYSGSAQMARELLSRGWYLGFGGVITFKNARKVLEVLEICPLERILIETDCPYLAPMPYRGKRNDSRLLSFVAEKIADIKGISPQEVIEATAENGKRLFAIE